MNEMNNGGNNNQNFEQPVQNQQYVQPEQQYVQPEQPVSEPPKKSNLLTVILILLVLGLAGFIVYDKVIKKDETTGQSEVSNGNTAEPVKSTEKIEVVDAYHSSDNYFIVPKLTGNSANVSNFNETLKKEAINYIKQQKEEWIKEFEDRIKELGDAEENRKYIPSLESALQKLKNVNYEINDFDSAYKVAKLFKEFQTPQKDIDLFEDGLTYGLEIGKVKYVSNTKNNIIAIVFDSATYCPASCGATEDAGWYFYDTENDQTISFEEAVKKFGATLDGKKVSDFNVLDEGCFYAEFDGNGNINIVTEDVMC